RRWCSTTSPPWKATRRNNRPDAPSSGEGQHAPRVVLQHGAHLGVGDADLALQPRSVGFEQADAAHGRAAGGTRAITKATTSPASRRALVASVGVGSAPVSG